MDFTDYDYDLPDDWRRYNVTVRCSLCNFELVEADRVVAVRKDGKISHECVFIPNNPYMDEQHKIEYDPMSSEWSELSYACVSCHVQCASMGAALMRWDFFEAMFYTYNPAPSDIARRDHWLQSDFTCFLHKVLQPFLVPVEICQLIAQHCSIREHALSTAEAFWRKSFKKEHKGSLKVSLTSDVWARYVEFEGVRYIVYLTNTPSGDLSKIFSALPGQRIKSLSVAEDHLGVRELRFSCDARRNSTGIKRIPGLWWRTFNFKKGNLEVDVWNDGTKLRFVKPAQNGMQRFDGHAFEVPISCEDMRQLRICQLNCCGDMARMTSLVLNYPCTTAYSVCCDYRPYTIRAHFPRDDDLFFYDAGSIAARHAVWLYMPMDKDERITEIWHRRWEGDFVTDVALIFCTNTGKTHVMGLYPAKDSWGRYSYTLIYESSAAPDHIFFDININGIHDFGFKNPIGPRRQALPKLPQPESFLSPTHYEKYNYFYSSASLDGVVEVTPCLLEVPRFGPAIMGLLLHYEGGCRATIGQIRTDMLQLPIAVDMSSQSLCLQFSRSEKGLVNVSWVGVQTRPTSDDKIEGQLDIPWHGKLEWWFCRDQSWLYHKSKSSPMPSLPANMRRSGLVHNITPTIRTSNEPIQLD